MLVLEESQGPTPRVGFGERDVRVGERVGLGEFVVLGRLLEGAADPFGSSEYLEFGVILSAMGPRIEVQLLVGEQC